MKEKEQIKEINQHISHALKQWANILLVADADDWAYYLDYSDEDVFNAVYIVNHVLMNRAIKSGYIKGEEDALIKATNFKNAINAFSGIDTIEMSKKLSEKWKSELEESH